MDADITNALLYRDNNGNKTVDGGDTTVGGSGAVSIMGQTGTLAFTADFTATTTSDYIVVFDAVNVRPSDMFTVSLVASDITALGTTSLRALTPTGLVSWRQQVRGGAGGGSGAGGGATIGQDTPAGNGIITGGGAGGGNDVDPDTGDSIGNEPGFNKPSSTGLAHNEWSGGSGAYTSDGVYVTASSSNLRQSYADFSFNIPSNNQVTGIEVRIEASGSTGAGTVQMALSWNGDSNITAVDTTGTLAVIDSVYVLGGSGNTWGRSWTPAELSDTNFRLRIVAQPSSNTVRVDAIQVKVYHIATGGGGGGGGDI